MPDPSPATDFQTDAHGIITSGPMQGYALKDVIAYAAGKHAEDQARAAPSPAAAPPPPPADPPPPAAATAGADRVASALALMAQRHEQDDEAVFAATVQDYDQPVPGMTPAVTYRQAIAELKKTFSPEQRMQRDFHQWLYGMVKMKADPQARTAIYGGTPPPADPPPEPPEPPAEPVADPPPPAHMSAPASSVRAPVTPKPAPPTAPPTPGTRAASAPAATPKPKLKPNEKVERLAKAYGQTVDAYLLLCEQQGMTQADLDAATAQPASRRRSTLYDTAVLR